MTAQEYRLQTTAAVTQGAAVIMALIAVLGMGLMGFAMGYAKAGRSSPAMQAQRASSQPGIAAARVSLVTSGQDQIVLASAEPHAPIKRLSQPTAAKAQAPVDLAPAVDTAPTPQAEPIATSESAPVAAPV